jgi:hypothetical protein
LASLEVELVHERIGQLRNDVGDFDADHEMAGRSEPTEPETRIDRGSDVVVPSFHFARDDRIHHWETGEPRTTFDEDSRTLLFAIPTVYRRA